MSGAKDLNELPLTINQSICNMPGAKDLNELPLTINLLHGEGFKNVNPCTAMRVYVRAYIKGQESQPSSKRSNKMTTNVDKYNGANPVWNSEMKFNLDQRKLLEQDNKRSLELVLKVKASSPLFLADKKLGEVRVLVKDLYDGVAAEEMMTWTSLRCNVVGGSRRYKGAVYFSYRFGSHGDEVDSCKVAVGATASAPPLPFTGI